MRASLTGYLTDGMSPYLEIHQALRAHSHSDTKPHLLTYASVARLNPYQSLVYKKFPNNGIVVAPMHKPYLVHELSLHKPRVASITMHFHWMNWLLAGESNHESAMTKINGYMGRINKFKRTGGNVVWTVHNVYPHDALLLDAELELQQKLADISDVIHTMTPGTLEAMSDFADFDESKVVVSPHPSYEGSYEDYMSRAETRSILGLDGDDFVFVIFGALKEYKGLNQTLDAFNLLLQSETPLTAQNTRRIKLLIAGAADDSSEVRRFVRRALVHPNVLVEPTKVPGARAQIYLNASDAGIVAYRRSLNSGAALLYQSFGLPVVAMDTPVLRETLSPTSAIYVTDTSVEHQMQAMREMLSFAKPGTRHDVLSSISHLHADSVSNEFAERLKSKLKLR